MTRDPHRDQPVLTVGVVIEVVRIRNGLLVFQCRTDDDRGFPVLEIPRWMFDAGVCCRIEVSSGIMVRCEALRDLRALLAEAQQSSWISGGADAEVVETKRRSAQSVQALAPSPALPLEVGQKAGSLLARMLREHAGRSRQPQSEANDE
jgi:hypothetical protein